MNTLFNQGQLGRYAIVMAVIATWGFCGSTIQAKPLGHATVTLVNNDVRYKPGAGDERAAKPKDVVKGSDTVRTGQKSQAELEFEDRTITRLGSNSTFTFDPDKREFQLKKGLLLFDMPKGAGGGKIITPAGTAAIEGTAGIVSYRSAPKIICLAGVINVLNPNGQLLAKVMPGQLFIVGVTKHPVDFMLNGIKGGKLMKGGLPNNTQEFDNSSNGQLQQIQSGQLQPTPFVMLGEKTDVFIAPPTTTDNQYPQTPEINPDHPPTPPAPTTFAITSDTTIDAGTGTISGTDSLQGTVQGGKAIFNFGSMNVTVTGNPVGVPAADGMFNADFNTQGTASFDNLLDDTNIGGSTCNGVNLTFNASSINVVNSNFEIGGDGDSGPSSMSFYASGTQGGNVIVDPSTLRVRSGVADGSSYTPGLIHLESANGYVAFVGSGYDPSNDPDDLLRSHAQATINVGEGIYNGGTVEFVSNGTQTQDGVYVSDATIDVAARDSNGYLTSGKGGSVLLNGKMRVVIQETVDIDATGYTPGTVTLQSSGSASLVGSIRLEIGDPTGHITIDAQPSGYYAVYGGTLYGDGGSSANYININGSDNNGAKTILFNSTGPLGGGNVILSTTGDISVYNAAFDISSTSYDGGSLTMGYYSGGLYGAASLSVSSTKVNAGGATTGTGGTVQFAAGNVSVTGSGWTEGGTLLQAGGMNGGIVSLFSTGEESGDMIYLRNVGIDAASYNAEVVVPNNNEYIPPAPLSTGPQGGQVNIEGTSLVRMEGTTMIQASGPVPGTISVSASGVSPDPGYISLDAGSGFIGLLASTFRVEDYTALSTMSGEIGIEGDTLAGGTTKTIQFSAPGGAMLFSAENRIGIRGANLDVSGSGSQDGGFMVFGYTSTGGYNISELTHEITVRNSTLLANATTGAGGSINMMADADSPDAQTTQGIHFGPNADVQANGGGGAGTITLAVEGGTSRAAAIGFNTERHSDAGVLLQEGYVRLTALGSSSAGSTPTAGSILIQGTSIDGDKSINITAMNDLGGRINFNARESITIKDAMLNVESYASESESSSWVRLGYYNELTDVSLPTGRISLTGTIIAGNGSGVQGANVSFEAYERIDLFDGTEIQVNSDTTPGNVTFQSSGNASQVGNVSLMISDPTSHITIDAQPAGYYAIYGGTLYGDSGSSDNSININGWDNNGTKTVLFNSTGPLGGGNVLLSTTGDISVNNAAFDISSTSYDGGSLTMGYYSDGLSGAANLTVSSTKVNASGATTGTGGTVQFAAGNVSVTGSGWTEGGTLIQAGGMNGGTVSFYGTGGESGDMIYLRNVGIDAASYDAEVAVPNNNEYIPPAPLSTGHQGGQVNIEGTSLVRMEGTTMIQTSGGKVPGTISVSAAGVSFEPGYISLDAGSSFIGLLASTFRVEDYASLSTMAGEIALEGYTLADGTTKTIQFSAPGGMMLFSAENRISIRGANLDVSGSGSQDGGFMVFGYTSTGGFNISELTHEISVANSTLLANAYTGTGGGITMMADADSPDAQTDQGIHFGPNTDVQANGGGGAGTISLAVEGGTTRAAKIVFNTEKHSDAGDLIEEGYVRLTALNSSSAGSAPAAGNILIQGTSIDGDKSINIAAMNDLGGRINFNARESIIIKDAMLNVESYSSESESWVGLDYYNESTDVSLPTGRISLTGTIINGNSSGGQGARVWMNAYERVDLFGGTDIQVNSDTTPGNVTIQVFGTASTPGVIALNVPNSTDYIKIEAQSGSSDINGGEISLLGYTDGGYNINLQASGTAGGGQINLISYGGYYAPSSWVTTYLGMAGIHIQGARLDASATSGTTLPAGQITLQAPYVGLDTAYLSAGDSVSYADGTVGRIEVSGVNPNGTHLGTSVNIANSRLTVGGTTVADGGILITGDTVTIDETSMYNFDPGPAHVHIQSRQNTGGWSTSSSDLIYWTPLYYVINNATTIDASGESVPAIVGPDETIYGTFNGNMAVFDLGARNVLMWSSGPNTIDGNGLFAVEFNTSGSFEALNMQNGGSGGEIPQTALVTVRAAGIQIINSTFNMGDTSAPNGPSQFLLYSSTDAIAISPYDSDSGASPSLFAPRSGLVNNQETGGTFHFESAGVTTLFGGDTTERMTEVLVGAEYQGGTVDLISTGDGSGSGGSTEGVHIRNASIDVSHALIQGDGGYYMSSTPAQVGGNVTVDGKKQVTIQDTTDIYADGDTAGSIQVISEGTASTAGKVVVNNESSTGYIRLSAQDSATVLGALTGGGDINIVGAPRSSGSENVQIVASGPMGGGHITITAIQNLGIINAQLNANGAGSLPGGAIALAANNVNINNSFLTASSASGAAGLITITGYSSASILNSILQTLGATVGSSSGIYISSPTVNLAGTTLRPGPTGSAQIYANTLVNPPASGSYVLNPYSAAPPK